MLLTEFDPTEEAVINPWNTHLPAENCPETCISIFSHHLLQRIAEVTDAKPIFPVKGANGSWPVYEASYKGNRYALFMARVGAPACVGDFEDLIAMGVKRIILLGNCGVLDKSICDCGIIIPTLALRDEGTSFHYAPPSDSIPVNRRYIPEFQAVCKEHGYSYVTGTTWTTDAFYRETKQKVAARKAMGAVCVEMECAAMQAMCDFRKVEFFQFLYAGDNLDHPQWDPRSLSGLSRLSDKERIALLAFELADQISRSTNP